MSLEKGAAPPSVLCQGLPLCLLGPWVAWGQDPPFLPPWGPWGGCRSLVAREATCLLPLGSLEGLKDHFQCWQDLKKVSDEMQGCPTATS